MFPQFKKLNNESGIVLFLVLMTAIVIMIFSVGILTQSMNEINYAQQQIDEIQSDQLSKGIFWNSYASGMNSVPTGAVSSTSLPGAAVGRAYQVTVSNTAATNGITTYTVITNYDTF